jgi:hypothetical protein
MGSLDPLEIRRPRVGTRFLFFSLLGFVLFSSQQVFATSITDFESWRVITYTMPFSDLTECRIIAAPDAAAKSGVEFDSQRVTIAILIQGGADGVRSVTIDLGNNPERFNHISVTADGVAYGWYGGPRKFEAPGYAIANFVNALLSGQPLTAQLSAGSLLGGSRADLTWYARDFRHAWEFVLQRCPASPASFSSTGEGAVSYAKKALTDAGLTETQTSALMLIGAVMLVALCVFLIFSEKRASASPAPAGAAASQPSATFSTDIEDSNQKPIAPEKSLSVVDNPVPATQFQAAAPLDGIVLKLKRTQKQGFSGPIYMLDARMDASAQIRALIAQHKLGSRVIYESSDRERHRDAARAHLDGSGNQTGFFAPPSEQLGGIAKSFWKLGRAAVSAARASLALRVTVDSLLAGVHVECKSIDELLDAEGMIKGAKSNLEAYVKEVQSFDGREEII